MKKTILFVFAIVGGVVLLSLGFYSGSYWVKQQALKVGSEPSVANLLNSKVINGLTAVANGQIKEVSGRNLIIAANGETLSVSVKDDADIGRLLPTKENTNIPQPMAREDIKFEEMKVGDQVNIFCNLKTDLSLEGSNITVLP